MPSWESKAASLSSMKIYRAKLELGKDDGLGGVETKTLRFTDLPILPPSLASKPHFDLITGPPEIRWQMRLSQSGKITLGLGRLRISNRDGQLDDDLRDYVWTGRPIYLEMGFDGLHTDDFRAIMTGQTGDKIKKSDAAIDIPLTDPMSELWSKRLTPGTYSDTLPNLVSTCLSAAGITNIDSTAWAAWAADNNFNVWTESKGDDGEETGTIMQRLLGPIGCDFGFDPDGTFTIGTLSAPSGTADLTLNDQAEVFDSSMVSQTQLYKLSLKYYTVTGSSPEYGTLTQTDASILDLNGQADDDERTTCLTSATDAQTVLNRLWALFKELRTVISVTCKAQPWALTRRGQVAITGGRYDIDGLYRLVGLRARLNKAQTVLELWR